MAKSNKKQLSPVIKECEHLNEIIKKGFPVQTHQGEQIIRFEVKEEQIIPILKETA